MKHGIHVDGPDAGAISQVGSQVVNILSSVNLNNIDRETAIKALDTLGKASTVNISHCVISSGRKK